jgi:hypothetical protein
MTVNPDRQPKWPRLPWARTPEWRGAWRHPEAENLAERVESLWARDPLPARLARRLLIEARRLEALRDGPERSGITWFLDAPAAEIERATKKRDAENERHRQVWVEALATVDRVLAEVAHDLDAAAQSAEGGNDADRI